MATLQQKIEISAGSAALFALVNLPATYKFTNDKLGMNLYDSAKGCPTSTGLLAHALVFGLLSYLSMRNSPKSDGTKLKYTVYATLIFFFVASPAVYSTVGSLLGTDLASADGCPSVKGVLLHAVVYCAALVAVMYLPSNEE